MMSGNPQSMLQQLMHSNPQMYQQFRRFLDANRGKTPEQVAQENGIDFNDLMRMFG